MPLRIDEEFVGRSLVTFFGGSSHAGFSEGEDPPDLYLNLSGTCIGVEVTQLSQLTFRPGRTHGNRRTQDAFGLRMIDELDHHVENVLSGGVGLLVVLWVPVAHPTRYRKALKNWIAEVSQSPKIDWEEVREIEGSKVSVKVIPRPLGSKAVTGAVANTESSSDIGMNARVVLEERILAKTQRCVLLPKPVWLALFNDYWLADADSYALAAKQIKLNHCFERIFLVSDNGAINEIRIEA